MVSLAKMADACDSVALDIKRGRLKSKDLRRNYVFFSNGACGCAFGHVLDRAGARTKLLPYFTKGAAGGKSPRWTDNCGAFTAATGIRAEDFDDENPVSRRLMALELANDTVYSYKERDNVAERRLQICNALWDLAAELRAA